MISICANRFEEGRMVSRGMVCLHYFSEMAYAAIYRDSHLTLCVQLDNVVVVSFELMQLRLESDEMISHEICGICEFEFAQFVEAMNTCKSICSLTFHLNATVRDVFLDGIYAKCGKDVSCFRDLGPYLNNCASSLVEAMESKNHVVQVPLAEGTEKVKLIFSETVCVYCEKKDIGMDAFSLKVHPYVPVDYKLRVLYFCQQCHSNYMNYRKKAVELGLLVLPGEYNEEVCACCADSPTQLVLCSKCPRSFCDPCLQRLLTPKAYSEMKSEEHWLCMCCAPTEAQFRTIASILSLSLPLLGSLSGVSMNGSDVKWIPGSVVPDMAKAEADELDDTSSATCEDAEKVCLLLTEYSSGEDTWPGSDMEPGVGSYVNGHCAVDRRGKLQALSSRKASANGDNARSRRNKHITSNSLENLRPLSKKTRRDEGPSGSRARHQQVNVDRFQEPSRKVSRSRSKDSLASRSINGESWVSNRHYDHGQAVVMKEGGTCTNDTRRHSTRTRPTTMKIYDFDKDTDAYIASLSKPGPHSCTYRGLEASSSAAAAAQRRPSLTQKRIVAEKPRKGGPTKQAVAESPSTKPVDSSLLPPVNTVQDEVYYFSQYVDYLLALQSTPLELQDTEDFCFLCKDGGDLIECDSMRDKGPHSHCKKVYHEYCLPYSVDEDSVWRCFRHFCGVCGKETCTHHCKLCPNSFCECCIAVWSENLGHRSYILSQGTFTPVPSSNATTKKGPGRKKKVVVDIICGSCIRMIERCKERGMWNESIELGPVVSLLATGLTVSVDGADNGVSCANILCSQEAVCAPPITTTKPLLDLQMSCGLTTMETHFSSSVVPLSPSASCNPPNDVECKEGEGHVHG